MEASTTVSSSEVTALIEAHLPLVKHVVLQVAGHFPRHVDRQELARAGALGLVEAARRYDASRGVPFDRFAARRIRGAILDAVRAVDWAPRSVRALGRSLEAAEQELASTGGTSPSPQALAAAMGLTEIELAAVRDRVFRSVVLALEHGVASGDDDEDLTLGDMLADRTAVEPAESLEARELLGYLRDAVKLLPERHRIVVVGYFLDGRSSADLAALLDVTESRISQIRSEALEILRRGIEAQYDGRDEEPVPSRSGRRRAEYASAIGGASAWRDRLANVG
ncbi:MAG: sigma-70 family RNA polymerase sigma factor [Acidimicrobiia bacterium]|nr:sigma-70 family RNA polymerase sigma factor [Acidimicrobiia bacterium]